MVQRATEVVRKVIKIIRIPSPCAVVKRQASSDDCRANHGSPPFSPLGANEVEFRRQAMLLQRIYTRTNGQWAV